LEENNYALKREKQELVDSQGGLKDRIRLLEEDSNDRTKELTDRDTLFKKKEKEFNK
jgi:hypothetical protein